MEVKVVARNIEKLKVTTVVREAKYDKEGEIAEERRVMTVITFESEIDPATLGDLHCLQAANQPLHALFGSTQAVLPLMKADGVFAERE